MKDILLAAAWLYVAGGVCFSAGGWLGFLGGASAMAGVALLIWAVKR